MVVDHQVALDDHELPAQFPNQKKTDNFVSGAQDPVQAAQEAGVAICVRRGAVVKDGEDGESQRPEQREMKPDAGLVFGADYEEAAQEVERENGSEHREHDQAFELAEQVPVADVVGVSGGDFRIDEAEEQSSTQHDNWDQQEQEKREEQLLLDHAWRPDR